MYRQRTMESAASRGTVKPFRVLFWKCRMFSATYLMWFLWQLRRALWLTPNEVAQDRLIPGFVTSSCPAGAKKVVLYARCICAVLAVGPRVSQEKRCSLGCFSEECIFRDHRCCPVYVDIETFLSTVLICTRFPEDRTSFEEVRFLLFSASKKTVGST